MNSNSTQQSMDKNSKFNKNLESYCRSKQIPEKVCKAVLSFYESYCQTVAANNIEKTHDLFTIFLDLIRKQLLHPFSFEPYHKSIRAPFDYYSFGIEFLRPLVDVNTSSILGKENIKEIQKHLQQKHNVIFLANHQIEADPLAISLLLEKDFSKLAEEIIFVAGERVITDPVAIPFSMGCNLLCIYSKRYIDQPPEQKHEKQLHNKKTMQLMSRLLSEGGKVIYVAPSGGRDRRNKDGIVEMAPFDPQSIEMFYLMAKKAKKPTFFYPMALGTYEMLPPPETIQHELGEKRMTKRVGIHLAIGKQIDMEHFPGGEDSDKHVRRKSRSDYIWKLVNDDYKKFSR